MHKLTKAWDLSSAPFFCAQLPVAKTAGNVKKTHVMGAAAGPNFCGGFSAASFLWEEHEGKRCEFVEHFTGADDVYRMSMEMGTECG